MRWTATDGSLDVRTLRRAYENLDLTPESLIDVLYERIARDQHPHAFTHLISQEEARAKARALGSFAEARHLPLFGVPFGVKDNIDVAGMPTTAACPGFSYLPAASAPSVIALEQAGAICLGKTNLDQFATGLVGSRSPYGTCRNVFDPAYLSGGSSSGSGVAVAAGYVSLALGTDTAGSGRVPAALNNIVGLKATRGLLSTQGVVPACQSLDCVSVFSLSVADAVLARELIVGKSAQAADEHGAFGHGFRFGVPEKLEWYGDKESEALFARAVETLVSLGGRPVSVDFSPFRELGDLLYGPWVIERYLSVGAFIEARPESALPVTREIILGAKRFDGADVFRAHYERDRLREACMQELAKVELIVTPTVPTHYRLSDDQADPRAINDRLGIYTRYANFLDVPVLAVPAGFRPDGLPFGLSLVGHPGRDNQLDALGAAVHALSECGMGLSRSPAPAHTFGQSVATSEVRLAVVGAHLRGLPLHHQLTECGARFVRSARTTDQYRLYVLPGSAPVKPGLVRVSSGGHAIELELYDLSWAALGRFMANVRAPLAIGNVRTESGEDVKCFLVEPYAVEGAEDISALGGFRAYLETLRAGEASGA
ncbi:MAG: allophanate hydrolase [Myxococcales bacterium]